MKKPKIASFFAGCGGLDLGFEEAGFSVSYANEFNPRIKATYIANHPDTLFDPRSIEEVKPKDIPDVDGIIGAPPCQSWSIAGRRLGIEDPRGRLFYPYISIIRAKQPKFFVAENVKGITLKPNRGAFEEFLKAFTEAGYRVKWKILNGVDYEVPQIRERVIVIGIRSDLPFEYRFPDPIPRNPAKITLRGAIGDLKTAFPTSNRPIRSYPLNNLEYQYPVQWSWKYNMALRWEEWDKPSYTVGTVMTSLPIHPDSPRGVLDRKKTRRLSIRECARIQTFPDSFDFRYDHIADGFLMIGNATPPRLAYHIASSLQPYCQ